MMEGTNKFGWDFVVANGFVNTTKSSIHSLLTWYTWECTKTKTVACHLGSGIAFGSPSRVFFRTEPTKLPPKLMPSWPTFLQFANVQQYTTSPCRLVSQPARCTMNRIHKVDEKVDKLRGVLRLPLRELMFVLLSTHICAAPMVPSQTMTRFSPSGRVSDYPFCLPFSVLQCLEKSRRPDTCWACRRALAWLSG